MYKRVCVPLQLASLNAIGKAMPSEKMMVYMGDVYDVRNVIIWVSVGAVICGFLFMLLLRLTIGIMVWALIILYFLSLLLLTWAFW